MAKGNPNDKTNGFVAKIRNEDGTYSPIYRLPDATSDVKGGVWLSDATNGTEDASTGVVAATPKAVAAVQKAADTKLDKATSEEQTVNGSVTFSGVLKGAGGIEGELMGNATTSDSWKEERTITVAIGDSTGSAAINGSSDATIKVDKVLAKDIDFNKYVLPLDSIPQGAVERLVTVADQAARFALTTEQVQLGDTVLQEDTGVMWYVVDEKELENENGYKEYAAGIASRATEATKLSNSRTISLAGDATGSANFDGTSNVSINATVGTADRLRTARTITLSGDATGSASFDGSKSVTISADVNHADSADTATTADSATKATQDAKDQQIDSTYIKDLSVSGKTITYTKGDGKTGTITTQDTTYSDMTGATESAAGTSGLVPAPAAGSSKKFLRGDGTWADAAVAGSVGSVTQPVYFKDGVATEANTLGLNITTPSATDGKTYLNDKGEWAVVESGVTSVNGKTGAVTDIAGAVQTSVSKDDTTSYTAYRIAAPNGSTTNYFLTPTVGILPGTSLTSNIGESWDQFNNVYAQNFVGHLQGSADSATRAATAETATTATKLSDVTIASSGGDVTATKISLTSSGAKTTTLTLNDSAVTSAKIADGAITQAKLSDDIGTVYVGSSEPTAESVKLWIKI